MYSLDKRIQLLSQWGELLQQAWNENTLTPVMEQEYLFFPWAVTPFVTSAITEVIQMLDAEFLYEYISGYEDKIIARQGQQVGVILPCNTPLSGMEIIVPVLLTGNTMTSTACGDNRRLLAAMLAILNDTGMKNSINLNSVSLRGAQKMIMPAKYAKTAVGNCYIKSKYPTYVIQERYNVAVLKGDETQARLSLLAKDMLLYFGMGQGSVKCVMVPSGYDFTSLFSAINEYKDIVGMHHKYLNNLEYQKTLHLFHSVPFLDQGMLLFTRYIPQLPPMAVVYYQYYDTDAQLRSLLSQMDAGIYNIESMCKYDFGKANAVKSIMLNQKRDILSFLTD